MPRFHFYKHETENVLLLEILDDKTQTVWHLLINRQRNEFGKETVTYSQGHRDYVPTMGATPIECPKESFMQALAKVQQQSAMFSNVFKGILKDAIKQGETGLLKVKK